MPRKKTQAVQLDLVDAVEAAVVSDLKKSMDADRRNSTFTDEQLIAENHKLEDLIKAAQKKLDEWAKPHKERIKEIELELFGRLNARGADSTRTDAGTAYFSTIMNTKVEDQEKLFDHIADHWDELKGDVQLNLAKAAVSNFMEQHNGQVPPGMSISHFKRLNIKRS